MEKRTIYTTYWVSQLYGIKKEHGSYETEEEALEGIQAWWEIQEENYDIQAQRTNTGALEINYLDENYVYRIESRETDQPLPSRTYKLKSKGEIEAKRKSLGMEEDEYLFDELAEAYRDRLMMAMADPKIARSYTYNNKGQPIKPID